MKKILLLTLITTLFSFDRLKTFPKFSIQSYEGKLYTQEDLKGKLTLINFYHLGCPPAMVLMNDLDSLQQIIDTSKVQIIGLLENTNDHINQFYNDTSSIWNLLKKTFKIKPVSYPLLAACDREKVKIDKEGTVVLGKHCWEFSRKIWTLSTPTILLIDKEGRIVKKHKGYRMYEKKGERVKWLQEFFEY